MIDTSIADTFMAIFGYKRVENPSEDASKESNDDTQTQQEENSSVNNK